MLRQKRRKFQYSLKISQFINKRIWHTKIFEGTPTFIHGDLQFDNVIYGKGKFKLIDWRHEFDKSIEIKFKKNNEKLLFDCDKEQLSRVFFNLIKLEGLPGIRPYLRSFTRIPLTCKIFMLSTRTYREGTSNKIVYLCLYINFHR